MTLPVVFTANGPSGYNLTKSLRFRSSASAYLNRTPASSSNRKTWTWSAWVKRGAIGSGVNGNLFQGGTTSSDTGSTSLAFAADKLYVQGYSTNWIITNAVYRDPSAWYHVVLAMDTTQATATNRLKLYVNGSEVSYGTYNNLTQNTDYGINQAASHVIGQSIASFGGGYFDGYMAEINFIDGQALTPSSFGETSTTTGVWQPKKYTGTYGTNGFYLPFTNTTSTSTLGNDFSGNSNTWTVNNISLTSGSTYDSMTDVPTLTSATTANYCVLNPLDGNNATLSGANLNFVTLSTGNATTLGSFYVSTGKWYWEIVGTSNGDIAYYGIRAGSSGYYVAYYGSNGNKDVNGSTSSYGATFGNNDIIGVALDMDAGTITFYKNNASQGAITIGNSGPFAPWIADGASGSSVTGSINFGQRPFSYTPPTGFVGLNTFNLPTPTIGATAATTANKYMNVSLWTGTGAAQSISTGFAPDFVWNKSRSNADFHNVFDSVRGGIARLVPNSTNAESSTGNGFAGLTSTGFDLDGSGGGGDNNASGRTYVGWYWKANGSGSTNTAGSITSTVSANTTAGFSIATFTGNGTSGATIGHGLGVAPSMAIIKMRSAVQNWTVYHASLGNTKALSLDLTDAASTTALFWNNTSPTSSLITLGSGNGVNKNTETYVAYCFAQVAGYSAFGSYTGNGSSDGPFVYLGFRPRYVLIKRTNTTGDWIVYDSARSTYNGVASEIYPNLSNAEDNSSVDLDFVSNGIKLRNSGFGVNGSGDTYIYACFAENPFKYSNAR